MHPSVRQGVGSALSCGRGAHPIRLPTPIIKHPTNNQKTNPQVEDPEAELRGRVPEEVVECLRTLRPNSFQFTAGLMR